jgi:hypothetical protein
VPPAGPATAPAPALPGGPAAAPIGSGAWIPAAAFPPGAVPAALPASSPAPLGGLDARQIVQSLASSGASAEVVTSIEGLLAELTALSGRVERLVRAQREDLQEMQRLEAVQATIGPTRFRAERLEMTLEEKRDAHRALAGDLQSIVMFLDAERAGRTDQLRVIEPAEAPLYPAAPNRPLFGGMAVVAALGLSLAVAALAETVRRARTYGGAGEVEDDLKLPVVAVLPRMEATAAEGAFRPAGSGIRT